jgi:CheY-like chemotaxis protein
MPPKLLLADDSVTVQRVIELTFADENVQVVSVDDGRQAIERVKADRPDIVLADVAMPGKNGYEVAAFIKGDPRFSSIPVLLLTAAFEPIDEVRARTIGCDGVLVKPFEPQMVVNRVRELLAAGPSAAAAACEPVAAAHASQATRSAARPEGQERQASSADYFERLDAAFAARAPGPQPGPPADPMSRFLPEAFAALLTAEQGRPIAPAVAAPPTLSDETIDEIARRVLDRMGDETMRRAVLDVAERVVREEIERIKRLNPRESR